MSSGEQFRESDGIQHELVGNSAAIVALAHRIARIAPAKLPVLIQGESGTGKELVARAVHANSPYSNGPFVAVNSAALSENLAKSELFGHERGSFTGAVAQQKGCFELANNGTLFLDEIGELNPSVQAMLLRVLQTCEFQRLGATHTIHVNVRSADMIRLQDLPEEIVASTPTQSRMKLRPLKEVMWEKKREYVAYVVKLVKGDYKLASNLLGIPAKGFHSLLRRLNLRHL